MYVHMYFSLPQGGSGRRKRRHPDFDTQSVDITFRVGVTHKSMHRKVKGEESSPLPSPSLVRD